jgi:hypothetical protein
VFHGNVVERGPLSRSRSFGALGDPRATIWTFQRRYAQVSGTRPGQVVMRESLRLWSRLRDYSSRANGLWAPGRLPKGGHLFRAPAARSGRPEVLWTPSPWGMCSEADRCGPWPWLVEASAPGWDAGWPSCRGAVMGPGLSGSAVSGVIDGAWRTARPAARQPYPLQWRPPCRLWHARDQGSEALWSWAADRQQPTAVATNMTVEESWRIVGLGC